VSSKADSEAAGPPSEGYCSRNLALLMSVALGMGTVFCLTQSWEQHFVVTPLPNGRPQNSKASVGISLKVWNAVFLKALIATIEGPQALTPLHPAIFSLYLILPLLPTMKTLPNGTLVPPSHCSDLFWYLCSSLCPCPALKVYLSRDFINLFRTLSIKNFQRVLK